MTEAWRRERLWRAGDDDVAIEASVASVAVSMSKVRKVILLSLSVVTSLGEVCGADDLRRRQMKYASNMSHCQNFLSH